MAHLINEVTISEEGYIVIRWQRTGNGVYEVPSVCRIVGEHDFFPCKLQKILLHRSGVRQYIVVYAVHNLCTCKN